MQRCSYSSMISCIFKLKDIDGTVLHVPTGHQARKSSNIRIETHDDSDKISI